MNANTKDQITVAGVVGAITSAGFLVYMQWRNNIGKFVEDHPVPAALILLAFLGALAWGITKGVMHRRHISTRVRPPRREAVDYREH